ncbi:MULTISPECIES: hypothetical protein [Streptomyces]|uniref:Uncharacterized protein n=1 Tax=Streptomyces glycanivorans TaxID=3033808 RepID=A0ABY9JEW9_9ACTN|nr:MULTISPECIES: hypothetical protein [unclassified Streptomyces]WLQ64546.1 hypothetical protein P8A20_13505 [Streptomyces sp. Alt3]WSR08609.1 hypothetical protein OG265_22560 [Streptomyces sp. NBC_01208]WSR48642.1 hypothetical protein OG279_13830 [Streptomyces sp. NBC_01201]
MRSGRPVVIAWALLVAGGWAATLWLGEPSATAGPDPAPAAGVPADNPEPGPQPEGSCPRATPAPSPSAVASLAKVPEMRYGARPDKQFVCTTVIRDHATVR